MERNMADTLQALQEKFERLEVKLDEKDTEIQELQKVKQEQERKLQETQANVARVEEQLKNHVQECERRSSVAQFTMSDFQQLKSSDGEWYSSPVYTHPGGYRVGIEVYPNGWYESNGTHVAVGLCTTEGENDHQVRWPAECTITLQLLNQHRDQDHVTVTKRERWYKPQDTTLLEYSKLSYTFIAHEDLEWNAEKQTQYLKNDCLQFRITEIQVHSI